MVKRRTRDWRLKATRTLKIIISVGDRLPEDGWTDPDNKFDGAKNSPIMTPMTPMTLTSVGLSWVRMNSSLRKSDVAGTSRAALL